MILIGQYDSPFVRRVGIALSLYGMPFEHRPWSVFADADKISNYNPLLRVPTLVLDDGADGPDIADVLVDSHAILDYLDHRAGPGKAMFPKVEPDRYRAIKIAMLASGLGDKAVSLFYERRLHVVASDVWIDRCRAQIGATLVALEADRTERSTTYWFAGAIGHADIAVAVMLRFLMEAHPGVVDWGRFPALRAHCAKLEAMPVFREISQPFIPPA